MLPPPSLSLSTVQNLPYNCNEVQIEACIPSPSSSRVTRQRTCKYSKHNVMIRGRKILGLRQN